MFQEIVLTLLTTALPANVETVDKPLLASVITEVTGENRSAAIALIVQIRKESLGSARIQSGDCRGRECDVRGGRTKARCIAQVHDDRDGELWENSVGLTREALTACLTLAHNRLSVCKTLEQRYSAQSGKGCVVLPFGKQRAALHRHIEARWWTVKARLEAAS